MDCSASESLVLASKNVPKEWPNNHTSFGCISNALIRVKKGLTWLNRCIKGFSYSTNAIFQFTVYSNVFNYGFEVIYHILPDPIIMFRYYLGTSYLLMRANFTHIFKLNAGFIQLQFNFYWNIYNRSIDRSTFAIWINRSIHLNVIAKQTHYYRIDDF